MENQVWHLDIQDHSHSHPVELSHKDIAVLNNTLPSATPEFLCPALLELSAVNAAVIAIAAVPALQVMFFVTGRDLALPQLLRITNFCLK